MSNPRFPLEFLRKQKTAWKTPGIDARAVAEKMKFAREMRHTSNAERLNACPRLGHLLWFIQDMSHQPGGLELFARDLLLASPERLRTREMARIRWPRSGRYTVEEAVRIWRELNGDQTRPKGFPTNINLDSEDRAIDRAVEYEHPFDYYEKLRVHEWIKRVGAQVREILRLAGKESVAAGNNSKLPGELFHLLAAEQSYLRKLSPSDSEAAALVVATLTPEAFWTCCAEHTLEALPATLVELATKEDESFDDSPTEGRNGLKPETWRGPLPRFDGLLAALFAYMDRHAEKGRRAIAATSVSAIITDRFEYSVMMGGNVLIVGDARLGKTVALKNECRRNPGRSRLVTIPANAKIPAIVQAHADALHMSYNRGKRSFGLEADVCFVLQHGGLHICYDEIHFAIPSGKSNRTPPALDWIRTHVVDRNLGVVFSATRQAYNRRLADFMQHAKWAIAQWAGRIDSIQQIGEDKEDAAEGTGAGLTFEDVLAIVRNHQPDLDPTAAEMVAEEAYGAASPAHAVNSIVRAAAWQARKAHPRSPTPTAADVDFAIDEWKLQPAHAEFENPTGPPKIRKATSAKPPAAPPPARGGIAAVTPPGERNGIVRNRLSAVPSPALAGG